MTNEKYQEAAVDHRDIVHDAGAAVQLAHEVETEKPSPWTPMMLMFRLYLVLACAYLCGCFGRQSSPDCLGR